MKMASDFDAAPLHNKVAEDVGEDVQLSTILDAWSRAEEAADVRIDDIGEEADRREDIEMSAGVLSHVARDRALEVVAESCVVVIQDAAKWVEQGHVDNEKAESAVEEARRWLQFNTNAAARVDALDDVRLGQHPIEAEVGP